MSAVDNSTPSKSNPSMSDKPWGVDSTTNTNKTFTLQSIFNLFKTNLDAFYAGVETIFTKGQADSLYAKKGDVYTKAEVDGLRESSYYGVAVPSTVPTAVQLEGSGKWDTTTAGTYANMGGIVITAGDISDGRQIQIVYTKESDSWSKQFVGQNLGAYATKLEVSTKTNNSDIREESPNLVDPIGVESGSLNSSTGAETTTSDFYRTSLIQITGLTVTVYSGRWIYPFDAMGAFISAGFQAISSSNSDQVYTTVTLPVGTSQVRLVAHADQIDELMLVMGAENIPYQEFGFDKIKNSVLPFNIANYATNEAMAEKASISDLLGKTDNAEIRDYSPNLVDPSGVETGSLNSSTGAETTTSDFYRTSLIQITGLTVTVYSGRWIYPFDAMGAFISAGFQAISSSNTEQVYTTVTLPVGTTQVRLVAHADQIDELMLVMGVENIPYQKFGFSKIKRGLIPEISGAQIESHAVVPDKTNFFDPSINLIDPNLPGQGIGIIISGSGAVNSSNTDYMTTGYVPVLGNTTYKISSANFAGFYDTSKAYLAADFMGGSSFDTDGNATVTTSTNARFVRISATLARFPTVMIQLGAAFTGYVPFSAVKLKAAYIPSGLDFNINTAHRFYLSKVIAYGDSLIANDYFMPQVYNALGWNWTNKGVGGEKSYQIVKRLITDIGSTAVDFSDTNLFILCCGTNDRTSGTPLGNFGETWDNSTSEGTGNSFTCAIEEAVRQVFTVNKNISMVIFSPQKRTDASSTIWDGPNSSTGLYTLDYRNRILEICEKWSIPVVDFFGEAQKNSVNAVDLTTFGDTVHPNFTTYGPRLGSWVKRKLDLIA